MKIVPTGQQRPPIDNSASFQSQQQARERAISRLSPQPLPVPDANNISVEEMGALNVPTPNIQEQETDIRTQVEATEAQEETVEPKKDDLLSKQYALLARKEKALRLKSQQQEQQYKQREEQLKSELTAQIKAELEQQFRGDYIAKSRLKQSPLEVMAEADLSYDELTQQLINHQPADPRTTALMNKMEAKIQQLEKSLEDSNKNYSKNQEESYTAALRQIERDATSLVESDPEFEAIKATNSVKDIVNLIDKTWKEDGVVLSVEEAAKEIEDYLVDRLLKYNRIEKIQKRLAANASKQQQSAPAQPAVQNKQPQPMKTLTNASSVSRPLSARERAVLAYKGELKN